MNLEGYIITGVKVINIIEKPTHKFFVNAGIYVINQNVVKDLNEPSYIDMPDLLRKRLNICNGLNIFPLYEQWLDIGHISEFNKANNSN